MAHIVRLGPDGCTWETDGRREGDSVDERGPAAPADDAVARARLAFRLRAHRALAELCGDSAAGDVLVLCAGTGADARLLSSRGGRRGMVVASDIDHRLTELARDRTRTDPDTWAVSADAALPPFAAESFDLVYCAFGLHYFARPSEVVRTWTRLLRPGGTLGVTAWDASAPSEVLHPLAPPPLSLEGLCAWGELVPGSAAVVEGDVPYASLEHFTSGLPDRPEVRAVPGPDQRRRLIEDLRQRATAHWTGGRVVETVRSAALTAIRP